MSNTENSAAIFKYFKTMSFMTKQKIIFCQLPKSRGVIKQMIGIKKSKCWSERNFLLASCKANN